MEATKPRKRGTTQLPRDNTTALKPTSKTFLPCDCKDAAFHLVCESCRNRCAVDAKFCATCGRKLGHTAFDGVRTKLPTLDKLCKHPSSSKPLQPPLLLPRERPSRSALSSIPRKKRQLMSSQKPTRIAKLDKLDSPGQPPTYEQTKATEELEMKLKIWMASTRRLVESLLELKRRQDRSEHEAVDGARFQSIDLVVSALDSDLAALEPFFATDRNLQAKCAAMLTKLKALHHHTTQQRIDALTTPLTTDADHRLEAIPSTGGGFQDADVVIRGPDGKKMFFKARSRSPHKHTHYEDTVIEPVQASVMVAPHSSTSHTRASTFHPARITAAKIQDEQQQKQEEDLPTRAPATTRQFAQSRVPDVLLFRAARVDGRSVLLWLTESETLHQLVVDIYRPLTSLSVSVQIPLEWLVFILPPSVTWYRVSEIRRYKAVELHWSRCFDHVVRCLKWTTGNEISVHLPIQFRQACTFTFRSFASFYGFLSVQLTPHDYSLKIWFLNARTGQRMTLLLAEPHISRSCSLDTNSVREKLIGHATRKTLYVQVCGKLYVEYTSRGFELLFPGVKPKGVIRRHPLEIAIKQHRIQILEQEQHELRAQMNQCIQEVVVLARRRVEQYQARMRRVQKEKQEIAAKKIQARTRALVAKKKKRRQRNELRRSVQLQDLAATLIQHTFRTRREVHRQQRAHQLELHNTAGVRFRMCCRINNTLAMAIVTLDEIDAAANAFDCTVRIVHPSTSQTAQLRVAHHDVLRLVAATISSQSKQKNRRQIIEALLTQHLDVFRSATHNVLVLALRS